MLPPSASRIPPTVETIAKITDSTGIHSADAVTATFALPRGVLAEAAAPGLEEITFGVRPGNITLSEKGIPVTIDLVEELGADAFMHGHTPDGNRLVIRADARIHPSQGSTVYALPTDAEHCHVFDPNTGTASSPPTRCRPTPLPPRPRRASPSARADAPLHDGAVPHQRSRPVVSVRQRLRAAASPCRPVETRRPEMSHMLLVGPFSA